MNLISSLVFIASIVLVGSVQVSQAKAIDVNRDGSIIPHAAPTEELTQADIETKLGALRYSKSDNPLGVTVESLYKVKDKDTTVVADGLTADQLIEQNYVEADGCTQDALGERAKIIEYLRTDRAESGLKFGVTVYLLDCLVQAAKFCLENKQQVIADGHNTADWMEQMRSALAAEGTTDSDWAREIVWSGMPSKFQAFILDGPSWDKM